MSGDLDTSDIIAAVFVVVATCGMIYMAMFRRGGNRLAQRINRAQGEAHRAQQTQSHAAKLRSETVRGERSGSLARIPNAINLRLLRAGVKCGSGQYFAYSGLLGAIVALVTTSALGLPVIVGLLVGLVAAVGLPNMVLGSLIARRREKFLRLLPEALDLMVRTVKSGLPITEAISLAGEDLDEPLGPVFAKISSHLKIGQPLEEALWDAAHELGLQEFDFFVVSLSLQRETGGNLSETLENLSGMLRRRQHMRLKVRALSSEARASAWIIGALPFVIFALLFIVNPAYVGSLFSDPRGLVLLGVGGGSLTAGMVVMRRMAQIQV